MTSLPVPLSPSISIGISDDAIWRTRASSASQLGTRVSSPGSLASGVVSSSAGAVSSIGMRSKNQNRVWPSSISEPSASTARLVLWPSTTVPFLESVSTRTQRPKLGSMRACLDDIHLSGTRIVQLAVLLLGATIVAASEVDDGQVVQAIAHRASARAAGFEHEHQHGLGARPGLRLAIRMDA